MYSIGIAFLVIISLKMFLNGMKAFRCKRYLNSYYNYLRNPKWEYLHNRSEVIKLIKEAGVGDSYKPVVFPVGYGMVATHGGVSVLENFPNGRKDFIETTVGMFHTAIGVYKKRSLESLNPVYWIETAIFLPQRILSYLDIPTENVSTRILNMVWWVVVSLYAFMRPEINQLIKDWISHILA